MKLLLVGDGSEDMRDDEELTVQWLSLCDSGEQSSLLVLIFEFPLCTKPQGFAKSRVVNCKFIKNLTKPFLHIVCLFYDCILETSVPLAYFHILRLWLKDVRGCDSCCIFSWRLALAVTLKTVLCIDTYQFSLFWFFIFYATMSK